MQKRPTLNLFQSCSDEVRAVREAWQAPHRTAQLQPQSRNGWSLGEAEASRCAVLEQLRRDTVRQCPLFLQAADIVVYLPCCRTNTVASKSRSYKAGCHHILLNSVMAELNRPKRPSREVRMYIPSGEA